jgi:hypothetical protein
VVDAETIRRQKTMNVKTKRRKSKKTSLTKKELKHLKDVNAMTLDAMKRNFRAQATMRQENPAVEPCWTCRGIARKLGFGV